MAGENKQAKEPAQEDKKKEEKKTSPDEEMADMKDRLLRLAAEFDNYKKRSAKDMDGAKTVGKAELARSLLPTLDEFELALSAFNGAEHEQSHIKGIELVFSNILGALKGAGLKEIDSKGRYDPYKHEIVMTRESKEPEGTILEIVRKGYTLNDILLRPSAVIVSKGNASKQGE